MSLRMIQSYDSKLFRSFDEVQEFIDNLGYDDILIDKFCGYSPVAFMRRDIDKNEFSEIEKYGDLYTRYDNRSGAGPIMFRRKKLEPIYEADRQAFRLLGAIAYWPMHKLSEKDPIHTNHNNTICFSFGTDSDYMTFRPNYFNLRRDMKMCGMRFAGDCPERNYIEAGFTYKCFVDQ